MIKKIFLNKHIASALSIAYILALVILIAMLGFGFPNIYKIYVTLFFIFILFIGITKTFVFYSREFKKAERRVLIFDAVSIIFILYCIGIQLIDYSFFYVSKYLQFAIALKLIREIGVPQLNIKRSIITPAQLFVISFLSLVFGGSGLLMLPNATVQPISFLDALFTSTSAVCVTGLTTLDTASIFTPFGHFLILILIQAGGLGILSFAGYIAYFFKGNTSYENQIALGNIANNDSFSEVFTFVKRIILLTFGIEIIGAVFIFISIENASMLLSDKIFFSVFHSVSAFCNAGFSTLPNGLMNENFVFNYPFQSVLIILIFLGGIGFPILINILRYLGYFFQKLFLKFVHKIPSNKSWVFSLSSKVNLVTSLSILGISTVILFFEEYYKTLNPHQGVGKLVSAIFLAMTPRTAGFNHIDSRTCIFHPHFLLCF